MTRFEKVNSYVKVKNVHYDRKSLEQSRGIVKPKYKLAGNPIQYLDQFIFFICAGSHPDAYHKATRIFIEESEWINKDTLYPNRLCGKSCIDVRKYEFLTTLEVAQKMVDSQNGFKYIAELPDNKFQALQKKLLKTKYLNPPIDKDIQRLIAEGLQVTDEILHKLGL